MKSRQADINWIDDVEPSCSFLKQKIWRGSAPASAYIREESFGVRLGNTVLVTEDGPRDLMAGVPINADEIESLIN